VLACWASVPELQTDCEIVWCKLELVGHKTIYLSCFYNPKTSNENGYLEFERSISRAVVSIFTKDVLAGRKYLAVFDV
jgi:hypothetical protein